MPGHQAWERRVIGTRGFSEGNGVAASGAGASCHIPPLAPIASFRINCVTPCGPRHGTSPRIRALQSGRVRAVHGCGHFLARRSRTPTCATASRPASLPLSLRPKPSGSVPAAAGWGCGFEPFSAHRPPAAAGNAITMGASNPCFEPARALNPSCFEPWCRYTRAPYVPVVRRGAASPPVAADADRRSRFRRRRFLVRRAGRARAGRSRGADRPPYEVPAQECRWGCRWRRRPSTCAAWRRSRICWRRGCWSLITSSISVR